MNNLMPANTMTVAPAMPTQAYDAYWGDMQNSTCTVWPKSTYKMSNMWKIFKPTEVMNNYWCDEDLNMLSAMQLHDPKTIPYISYEMSCEHGTFTIRRNHKDKLMLKLELGMGNFMIPMPRKIAKKFLKIMNRYQEDPQVCELDIDWWTPQIWPGTFLGSGSGSSQITINPTGYSANDTHLTITNDSTNYRQLSATCDSSYFTIQSIWGRSI